MRKLFLGLAAAGLTFGSLLFAAPARAEYIDQDQIGTWSADYVEILTQLDILVGYPDGSFRPNENLTREEYAVSLIKALAFLEDSLLTAQFDTDWYLYQEIVALQTQLLEVLYQVDALAAKDLVEKNNFVAISVAYGVSNEETDDVSNVGLVGKIQIIELSDDFAISIRPFVTTDSVGGATVTIDFDATNDLTIYAGGGVAATWDDESQLTGTDDTVVGIVTAGAEYSLSQNTIAGLEVKLPTNGTASWDPVVGAYVGVKF